LRTCSYDLIVELGGSDGSIFGFDLVSKTKQTDLRVGSLTFEGIFFRVDLKSIDILEVLFIENVTRFSYDV
jgi:Fe-S cluster assembly iron-binding protein IscA